MVEEKKSLEVHYLWDRSANPHITDFDGKDACDKAKANGLARDIGAFNYCNGKKKVSSYTKIESQKASLNIS